MDSSLSPCYSSSYNVHSRRPLVFVTASYISGIAFCYLFSPSMTFLLAGLAALSAMLVFKLITGYDNKRNAQQIPLSFGLFICIVFIIGNIYASSAFSRTDPLEKYMTRGGGYAEGVEGHVLFAEQRNESYQVLTVWADGRKFLVRVYGEKGKPMSPAPEYLIGKHVSLTGELTYPDTARNPGCFNYRLHLLSKNIRVILTCAYPGDFIILDTPVDFPWNVLGFLARAKAAFAHNIFSVLPPGEAGLFMGMMFGDKETLDEDTYDLFKRHGVAHILSVSGLHVGMVYAFVSVMLGRRKTIRFYIIVLIILLCYAALSNFSPSVMRAFSMIVVHIGANLLRRRYDMLTGVLLSAFIMLLINPLALFGLGFILSYTAVISLAFALPFIKRYTGFINRLTGCAVKDCDLKTLYGASYLTLIGGRLLKILIPTAVIQFFMLPLTMYFFNCLPVTGVIVNIPVIAMTTFIVPFGLVILLLTTAADAFPLMSSFVDPVVGTGISSAGKMIDLMLFFTHAADTIPFGSYTVPSPPLPLLFLFYFAFFFFLSDSFALKRAVRNVNVIPVVAFIAVLLIAAAPMSKQNSAAYTFVDVGQGDCLHIRTKDGRNYLMDGGGKADYNVGKNILAPYLLKNGVGRLDGVFVSHLHTDHFKGLAELAEIIDIGVIYVYDIYRYSPETVTEAFTREQADETFCEIQKEINLRYIAAGDKVLLGKYASAEVLFPERLSTSGSQAGSDTYDTTVTEYSEYTEYMEDENKNSLIIRFTNADISVLMTGDISKEGEKAVMRISDISCDILKIAHHGSKNSTSEELITAATPAAAVIQVGKNSFGHPTNEALETISEFSIPVYRNDEDGAILIYPCDGGFRIKTMKGQ